MKSVGEWDSVSNLGFTLHGEGFSFSNNKIVFGTDGCASDEENEQMFRAFSKIVPSAVPQIRSSYKTGKNFEGNYDGFHVKGTFADLGEIIITN